jgi:hypothetical protein
VNARVEYRGDEIFVLGEGGEGFGGGELHFHVDIPGPGQQRPAKDAGVAQDVVHARPVSGEGRPRFHGVLGLYLRVGVGERQDHLPLAHHLRFYEARYSGRRHHHVRLPHHGLHVGDLDPLLFCARVARLVRVRGQDPLRLAVHHEGGDPVPRCSEPDLADRLVLQRKPRVSAGHDRRRERNHSRAVYVVVHHRLGQRLY